MEQNAEMALQVADHAYVLESGKIALSGTGEELAATDAIKKPTSAAEIKQKLLCQTMSDRAIFICVSHRVCAAAAVGVQRFL